MLTLYPDEKIIMEKRRFWLPIALHGVVAFLIAGIPFLLIFAFDEFLPQQFRAFVRMYTMPALFFATVWSLIAWVMFFVRWTDYYLDVLLVTNKRVLDIEQLGLFSRDISEARLENIQDMRVEIPGFLATTMDFGNLYIQTAGAATEFAIKNIPEPNKVKDAISHQCECLTSPAEKTSAE